MRGFWVSALLLIAVAHISLIGDGEACTTPPPDPPPKVWVDIHGDIDNDGLIEVWVGIEIDIFPPLTSTTCVCGLGIGRTNSGLPPSVRTTGVMITKTDLTTHKNEIIAAFKPLARDKEQDQRLAEGEVLFSDAQWFGFSGQIEPFEPPVLGPNEVFKMWFEVEVKPSELGDLVGQPVQFASGAPDDQNHPIKYFTALIPRISALSLDIAVSPNPVEVGNPLNVLLDLINLSQSFNAKFRLWALVNGNVTNLLSISPFIPSGKVLTDVNIFSTPSVPTGLPPVVAFLAAIFNATSGEVLDSDMEFVGIGLAPSATDITALRQAATDFLNSGAVNAAPGHQEPELNLNGKAKNPFEQRVNTKEKLTTTWGRIKSQR